MILSRAIAEGVAAGRVTLVFRRWARPGVRAGDTLVTAAGVVAVESVTAVEPTGITDAEARGAGASSAEALIAALGGTAGWPTYRIGVRWVGPDPRVALRADSRLSAEQRTDLVARLARLDRHSRSGPWTHALLRLVAANPGRRAGDLADQVGRERDAFKRDVRKLKNLGLTESLEVGYRISPRGAAYLAGLPAVPAAGSAAPADPLGGAPPPPE
ncbi:ASCH domain-containing protein [Plantactinospora endophytica]|uniref:ASCH domain-containing protein n=1 Tax=Plantactinospora endophytica TaxID=673535 RepID=A0ABQ4DWG4_9ACTN|nr:hypothetical protein [Plantactinospora endophytica]GIG86779.1 hypothetical protein Pen02_17150 [Plantactinospora endophytica]